MRKVYKYATGEPIPDGAVYLSTQVEKTMHTETYPSGTVETEEKNTLVWHYFLVDVDDEGKPTGKSAENVMVNELTMEDVTPDFRCTCRLPMEVRAMGFGGSQKKIDKQNEQLRVEAEESCKNCPVHGENEHVFEHQQTKACGACSGLSKDIKTGSVCMACLGAGRFIVSTPKSS